VSIIKKYGYRLTTQSGSQDEINSAISVDITRRNLKTANTCDNLKGLAPACRELQLDPVISAGVVDSSSLDADEIRMKVAVEIRYRKRQPRSKRNAPHFLGIRVCLCAAAK
jgi:hypothetical protein